MQNDAEQNTQHPDEERGPAKEMHEAHPLSTENGSTRELSVVTVDSEAETDIGHAFPFPLAGIGGSAGSLEPLMQMFKTLPASTGMAYVVVLHMMPNQESHLASILGRCTAMPVVTVTAGMVPKPNHVYVIPPNVSLVLKETRFQLVPRTRSGPFLPVNDLLQSLAATQKNLAIGVVLSGMDGDGALGLRAIKGEGGFSIVQTPESALHASMPLTSIESDHVDMVLPPADIPNQLAGLASRINHLNWRSIEEAPTNKDEAAEFARILKLLRGVSGIDFRLYKPTTVRRRIARRMVMRKVDSMPDYAMLLQSSISELRALQEDILINVTRFFRDPDVFEMLKVRVIPQIFSDREPEQQIRVWVAGCSTGEEVYSIAICLLEHLTGTAVEPSIQVFGTDASEENVHRARVGLYSTNVVNEVSTERLRRFFTKTEKGYQISKRVRDLCIFARQSLCIDPPFSRIDLVSCRNVLIYFGAGLQQSVISTVHYALRSEGFLLLGGSESIRDFSNLFSVVDRVHKLFTRIENPASRAMVPVFAPLQFAEPTIDKSGVITGDTRKDVDLSRLADRTILARYGPPGVVINARMEILQTRGRTSPFLELAPGTASLQLPRMLRDSIAREVIAAVSRAVKEELPVQVDPLRIMVDDETIEARLEVLPMPTAEPGMEIRYFLITFLPPAQFSHLMPLPSSAGRFQAQTGEPTVAQLQQDLSSTKLYLNSLLDEREATNQELISANEEIQSSNEELQSTNEELETTKEELQSSNEELQTVNDELEDRNSVLTQAGNDLTNLLNSVNLPVLMLSNELNIRHFTPQTQRLMNVRPQDVGRPFGEIRLNLAVEDLESRLLEVLETLAPQEIEVQDRDNRWYFLRIRPYRTTENKIEGLVLVLVDIDQSRRNQQELRNARDFAASVIANTPLPLVVLNGAARIVYVNDAFCDLTNLSRQTVDGRVITELVGGLWNMEPQLLGLLESIWENRSQDDKFECQYKYRDEKPRTLLVQAKPLQPDGERFILVTFQDISAHKEIERLLMSEGERLATQVAETTRELDRSREELRALTDSLMTSYEDERRHLARELHDDVSQRMALLDMQCAAALEALASDPAQARQRLQELSEQAAIIQTDVRLLSHRLHPSALEHLGLAAALESLLDEFTEREGMITTFYADDLRDELPLDVALGLYRITQEALRNVVKHAGKAHVKVSLHQAEKAIALEVIDSGNGFDSSQHNGGLGLISMKERARLLGASLRIQSTPRRGTTVVVTVPVPTPAA